MPILSPTTVLSSRTRGNLIDEVIGNLQGYVRDQESATSLASGVDASDLTIPISSGAQASSGIVEIGDELLWVESVDRNTGTLVVAPWGRGYQGTTAAIHSVGDKVTFAPRLPRWRVGRAIDETVHAIGLKVLASETDTFEYDPTVATYELPTGTNDVLDVKWQLIYPDDTWQPIKRYSVDENANTAVYTSGVTITLYDDIHPGQTVFVKVSKEPEVLSDDDAPWSETGLPDSCVDVAVLGAAYRLVAFADTGRLDVKSVEADALDEPNPFGTSVSLSKYFFQQYSMRLDEEMERFQRSNRVRIRYTRG